MIRQRTTLSHAQSEPIIRDYFAGKPARCPSGDGGVLDVKFFGGERPPTELLADCPRCGEEFTLTRPGPVRVKYSPAQLATMAAQLRLGRTMVTCQNCGARGGVVAVAMLGRRAIPHCRACGSGV